MTINVVLSTPKIVIPGTTHGVPNVVVLCDYFGCEKALNYERTGDAPGIIQHIIRDNPNGWTADRAKFYCGEHSQRVDKKKLRGQIRD